MKHRALIAAFLVGILALSACGPSKDTPAPTMDPNMVSTVVAQTLQAAKPVETEEPAPVPATTEAPSPVPPSAPTADVSCDKAEFVMDVNVPDGTVFVKGDTFNKTWKLRNIGTCTWNSGYFIQYENGPLLPMNTKLYLSTTVAPGQTVDITAAYSVDLDPGTYRSNWSLRNASGALVPISNGVNNIFYTEIRVQGASSGGSTSGGYVPVANSTCLTVQQNIQSMYPTVTFSVSIESFTDLDGVSGTACVIRAFGTGDDFVFVGDVMTNIASTLTGYIPDSRYAASGPTGGVAGYRNGNSLAHVSVHWDPDPSANCPTNQPISACPLLPSQQLYTVEVYMAVK